MASTLPRTSSTTTLSRRSFATGKSARLLRVGESVECSNLYAGRPRPEHYALVAITSVTVTGERVMLTVSDGCTHVIPAWRLVLLEQPVG